MKITPRPFLFGWFAMTLIMLMFGVRIGWPLDLAIATVWLVVEITLAIKNHLDSKNKE